MQYSEVLFAAPNPLQTYALTFLLGSLAVSSLSDLRRMAAQTDFAEVWAAFTAVMFFTDTYLGLTSQLGLPAFITKWAIIFTATAVTASGIMHVSTMDSAAIAALLSTLDPAHTLLALTLILITNELTQPLMRKYGEAGAYPFLPNLLIANTLMLALTQTGGITAWIAI